MRISFILVVLFCLASLSFAQLQLAPNPACPSNTPYCRSLVSAITSGVVPEVMGLSGGSLYGWVALAPGTPCPTAANDPNHGQLPSVSVQTFCFYKSSSLAPEAW